MLHQMENIELLVSILVILIVINVICVIIDSRNNLYIVMKNNTICEFVNCVKKENNTRLFS